MAKKTKVKDIAAKYEIDIKSVIKELAQEGIKVTAASSVIPEDMLELVDEHFKDSSASENEENESIDVEKNEDIVDGIHIKSPIIVKQLAETIDKKNNEVISGLMAMNVLANLNQTIDAKTAINLCKEKFNINLIVDKREKTESATLSRIIAPEDVEIKEKEEDLSIRPPIVTFMGHVDHGKTSLQDKVRSTDIVAGESGGITQHIGASMVSFKDKKITFIDTPGHAAFTAMRERGANITDIAILVVAADDGFMPQTIEAMKHILAAKVPMIVAINKMDLPAANPDKILLNMQQQNLMSEDWGGEVGTVRVSAETGDGMDDLLERILLESELLELKANPNGVAQGVVLESQLEQGMGATANIIVTNGTLKIGTPIICGEYYGKVKAMLNEQGERINQAGPSTPVVLVGLSGVPEAGAKLIACKNEKEARKYAGDRIKQNKEDSLIASSATSLENLFSKIDDLKQNTINIIIKSDVKGSGEAILDSLKKLPSDKIKIVVVNKSVGAITENDVLLATASNAILVGFHVKINPGVNALANEQNIEIRLYSVIYELLEDIRDAMEGQLEPNKREKDLGTGKILQIFKRSKGHNVCGCMIEKGFVKLGLKARVFRNKELIFNGEVNSLRRFQNDVKEVKAGLECGIRLDNFLDFQEEDIINFYDIELEKATL